MDVMIEAEARLLENKSNEEVLHEFMDMVRPKYALSDTDAVIHFLALSASFVKRLADCGFYGEGRSTGNTVEDAVKQFMREGA